MGERLEDTVGVRFVGDGRLGRCVKKGLIYSGCTAVAFGLVVLSPVLTVGALGYLVYTTVHDDELIDD